MVRAERKRSAALAHETKVEVQHVYGENSRSDRSIPAKLTQAGAATYGAE